MAGWTLLLQNQFSNREPQKKTYSSNLPVRNIFFQRINILRRRRCRRWPPGHSNTQSQAVPWSMPKIHWNTSSDNDKITQRLKSNQMKLNWCSAQSSPRFIACCKWSDPRFGSSNSTMLKDLWKRCCCVHCSFAKCTHTHSNVTDADNNWYAVCGGMIRFWKLNWIWFDMIWSWILDRYWWLVMMMIHDGFVWSSSWNVTITTCQFSCQLQQVTSECKI